MPQFTYTAIDSAGKKIKKTIVASSSRAAQSRLEEDHLFVVSLSESGGGKDKHSKLSTDNLIFFTQNVSTLLEAGMSLGEGLSLIADDAPDAKTGALYDELRNELEKGTSFSKALSKHPETFDEVFIALVQAGESSGKLNVVMLELAKNLDRDARSIAQVKSAFYYPAFILATLVGLAITVMFFVLPRIVPVFQQLTATLPLPTRVLIWISSGITNYPYAVIGGLILIVIGCYFFFHSRYGKKLFDWLSIHTPVVNNVVNTLDLFRVSSVMGLLVGSSVPIQEAIAISASAVKNLTLQKQFRQTSKKISEGQSFSEAFKSVSLPKTFIALVGVGEQSGSLGKVFNALANYYENRLDTAIKNFIALIEPTLTLIVALLVGVVVISILMPIYQVIGNISTN